MFICGCASARLIDGTFRDIQTKELSADIRSRSTVAMLPAVLADAYLGELQRADFDLLHPDILSASRPKSPFMMQMRLLRALWWKTI